MLKQVIVDETAKTLTLVLDLEEPTPSASGKTLVVASTRGNARTDAQINGKTLVVGVNAYVAK
jgi:hypothetical protein